MLILHSSYLSYLGVRRPSTVPIMNIRSIVNEASILCFILLFGVTLFIEANRNATAEVAVWLLLVILVMNVATTLYPFAKGLCVPVKDK